MRWINAGRFLMGSPKNEPERYDYELQHEVWLTKGYWIADTACTQEFWEAVMAKNPSKFKGKSRPVENVSWDDCQRFLDRMKAWELALPTEAQWEYACRAGTTTAFSFGDNVTTEQVNFDGNYPYAGGAMGEYREETIEVGSLPANEWGLHEMHGNIWEWCEDLYAEYMRGRVVDPCNREEGARRVLRGGSWRHYGRGCRSANRYSLEPDARSSNIGFRFSRGQNSCAKQEQAGKERADRTDEVAAERSGAAPRRVREASEGEKGGRAKWFDRLFRKGKK
jgi:formylglycine-generating enzyme required for sulfatase activity